MLLESGKLSRMAFHYIGRIYNVKRYIGFLTEELRLRE